jgi:hypothetical protein
MYKVGMDKRPNYWLIKRPVINKCNSSCLQCFENPVWKIILLFSLTVIFVTSFFTTAQGTGSLQIQAIGSTNIIKSSNKVAQLATNHNRSIADSSNTTHVLSSYVVQFGSNQNPNHRTLNNATVNGNDPIAQFGSNMLRSKSSN